jgi:predicted O-methyltransferase YrrM
LSGPFGLIFIDANQSSMSEYFDWSPKLARPGSVIIADNAIREGGVLDANNTDVEIQGVRRFNERTSAEKRVSSTGIQTVSGKGDEGFASVVVSSDFQRLHASPGLS